MIIIGEKINGAIPSVAKAIVNRDSSFIQNLAVMQAGAGAHYLDICAGTSPEEEYKTLSWLIDAVQEVVDTPLCIDSPDPHILASVFPRLRKPGLLNSLSLEGDKCDVLLPILRDNPDWGALALCCSQSGIASRAEDKVLFASQIIERAEEYGVALERLHIDPLVLALSAINDAAVELIEAIKQIKAKYPAVCITAAVSNISYGMPLRKLVNVNCITLLMGVGLDSLIADPLDRDVRGTIYAVEALLGRDKYCRNFNNAFRSGKIG